MEAVAVGWMGLSNKSAGAASGWEDPRRKLFKLKSELDALEATLQAADKNATAQGGDGEGAEGAEGENEDLKAMTAEVKSRLAALGMTDATSLATLLKGRQEDLSAVIAKDLKTFNDGHGSDDISKQMENMNLEGQTKDGKIVYELYKSVAAASSSTATVPREVLLEERLRNLELLLGSSSSSNEGSNEKSILERISEAEKLSKEVDPKTIEKLASKAKVIRADLEAAARAKTKLASKSSSSSSNAQSKEDAAQIAALHSHLQELEGLSAHLPALTVRLVELSNLHSNAAEFDSRLTAAEHAVGRTEGVLTSVEEALKQMEGGWKSNMESVAKNVERLDDLLAKAGGSS